jgi:hypothetical protein
VLLIFPTEPEAQPTVLTRIAERHGRRDLAVPAGFDAPFVDSLIATGEQHDPAFTPVVEHAWRSTAQTVVAYMTSRY